MRTINSKVSLALLAIFSMAIFACSSEAKEEGTNTPKEAATAFLDNMTKGDVAAAKEYVTSTSLQALDMMADMGDSWEGMSYELGDVSENGESATASFKLDGEDHMLDLKKVDGSWKVEYEFMMPGEDMGTDEGMDEGMNDSNMEVEDDKEEMKKKEDTKMAPDVKKEEGTMKKAGDQKMSDDSKMGDGK